MSFLLQKKKYTKKIFYILSFFILFSQNAFCESLKHILQKSLINDPVITKSKADEKSSFYKMKASESAHFPVVSVFGQTPIAQHNRYNYLDMDDDIGLQVNLNLYAWGGMKAAADRDKYKMHYFYNKFYETQEKLGLEICNLYIEALNEKESLIVIHKNINRHKEFVNKLKQISHIDTGRRSELSQALARYQKEKVSEVYLQRKFKLTLNNLSKYVGHKITSKDIEDPFQRLDLNKLITNFKSIKSDKHPSILAQKALLNSSIKDIKVKETSQYPKLNLQGKLTEDDKRVYLSLNWDLYNRPKYYDMKESEEETKSQNSSFFETVRDIEEKATRSLLNMKESKKYARETEKFITVQQKVASDYKEQFYVGHRSLLNVLDSYAELSSAEKNNLQAKNEFRVAALQYLYSKASIAKWAGVEKLQLSNIE